MKKTSIDALDSEIKAILNDYTDAIAEGVDKAVQDVTSQCLKTVKSSSASLFTQHSGAKTYAKQWTKTQTGKSRGHTAFTIYNRKPGLPHLLENGHVKANGGRVAGRPHIAAAEQEANAELERRVAEVIQNAGG